MVLYMRGHEYQKHDIPKMFLLSDDTLQCIKNNKQAKNVHRCVHVLVCGSCLSVWVWVVRVCVCLGHTHSHTLTHTLTHTQSHTGTHIDTLIYTYTHTHIHTHTH